MLLWVRFIKSCSGRNRWGALFVFDKVRSNLESLPLVNVLLHAVKIRTTANNQTPAKCTQPTCAGQCRSCTQTLSSAVVPGGWQLHAPLNPTPLPLHLSSLPPQSPNCLALVRSLAEQVGTFHWNGTQEGVVTQRNASMCMCLCVCDLSHLRYCKSLQQGPSLESQPPWHLSAVSMKKKAWQLYDIAAQTPTQRGTTIISKMNQKVIPNKAQTFHSTISLTCCISDFMMKQKWCIWKQKPVYLTTHCYQSHMPSDHLSSITSLLCVTAVTRGGWVSWPVSKSVSQPGRQVGR